MSKNANTNDNAGSEQLKPQGDNIARLPFQNKQEEPRLPKISPEEYDIVNFLDTCVAKASLTREEHNRAHVSMQKLLLRLENATALEHQLRSELQQLKAAK